MPKLWATTIETHRQEVRTAVVEAAGRLVEERGPTGVTMSAIAELAGIGRATLYKYFPDVDAILAAWHDDHVAAQVERLSTVAAEPGTPTDRLRRVLTAYAESRRRPGRPDHADAVDLVASLQARTDVHDASDKLRRLVAGLVEAAAEAGDLRDDVPPGELAGFALAALSGTRHGHGDGAAAAARLVSLTFDALAPAAARAPRPVRDTPRGR